MNLSINLRITFLISVLQCGVKSVVKIVVRRLILFHSKRFLSGEKFESSKNCLTVLLKEFIKTFGCFISLIFYVKRKKNMS